MTEGGDVGGEASLAMDVVAEGEPSREHGLGGGDLPSGSTHCWESALARRAIMRARTAEGMCKFEAYKELFRTRAQQLATLEQRIEGHRMATRQANKLVKRCARGPVSRCSFSELPLDLILAYGDADVSNCAACCVDMLVLVNAALPLRITALERQKTAFQIALAEEKDRKTEELAIFFSRIHHIVINHSS